MKPIKISQVEELLLHLKDQIQLKLNDTFISARYDELNKKLIFTQMDNTEEEVSLSDLASKTLDNYFEGENLFDKLFITTDKPFEGNTNNYNGNAGGHKQTGRRDYTSHSNNNDGYVDHLVIRLQNGLSTTRKIQIKYWIIEKNATVAQDNIIKEVGYQEYQVEEDTSLGGNARIARVPVKMKFENPTYFIYQVYTSSDMAYTTTNVGNESLYLGVANENAPLSVSVLENNIGQGDGINYSGSYAISGGMINVKDLLGADGTVKTVNRQPSDAQGNVTVNSEHIPYDNQTSQLASDNVKAAIDEINRKFVSDIRYDNTNRSLKQTKDGQESNIVDGLVTQWKDLDYVKEFTNTNILDYSKVQKNTSLNSNLEYANDTSGEWGVVEFPVTENEQYTLLRQRQYHVKIRFENNDGIKVGHINSPAPANKNWHRCVFNAPVGATKGVLEVRVVQSNEKDVMILVGDQTDLTVDINNPIPFFDNKLLQIGKEMSYAFDNSNSNIKSTTVESAIKELDKIVTKAGTVKTVNNIDPIDGNVTINSTHINTTTPNQTVQQALDGKINTAEVGNNRNQIPRIDGNGKLSSAIMPDLAITSVQYATDDRDMMNKTVQVGDIVVAAHEDNSTYMCKDASASSKNDRFIKINMGFPVVKNINGKLPDTTGAITINKSDIHGYKGNKILVYGDNFSFKDKWQTHVGTSLGATFFKLGDGTDPLCAVGTDTTNVPLCSVRKLENLTRSIQDNNIDTVLVMAGFNDFDYDGTIKPSNQGVISLKNPNDEYSSTTISGAMATVIKHMMLNHRNVRLFVCTFPNIKHQGNSTQDNQLEYKNSANISVAEINKTIKETAEFYGVPCIDVCGLSGIGKLNRSSYLENATTLNEEGNKAVANVVVNELLRFNKNI